jgi:pimeloyl-ACP methyl ester carboxylesterase
MPHGLSPHPPRQSSAFAGLAVALAVLLLNGCAAPIGAERVATRQAYAQVQANALRTGEPSAETVAILHRFDLDRLAARRPDQAVLALHQTALRTGERDLLFALAELSYVAGEQIRQSLKPWDERDARDYYLGSAVYAWLFLFGDQPEASPSFLDSRLRKACDFYNYGLGLALTERKDTNGLVHLQSGQRRSPAGAIELNLNLTYYPGAVADFEQLLLVDHFRVRGFSMRNRQPGLGAPLVCVRRLDPELGIRRAAPATLLLRLPRSLAEVDTGTSSGSLELYDPFATDSVAIDGTPVPLETDFTTHVAYVLNQSSLWGVGRMQFLAPSQRIHSHLIPFREFRPDLIPLVFVHGTFASPITWAELNNSLVTDPVVRHHYQVWEFIYGSGNSTLLSAAELRDALTGAVQKLDPPGTNTLLRQMVIIGHSQGGLLTKLTAISTSDTLWRTVSEKPLEEISMSEDQRARMRRLFFLEPLPFVRRVVFISTPHRGSYLASNFARRLASRFTALPSSTVRATRDVASLAKGRKLERFFQGRLPTSLDSMSPNNPGLLALAEIPVLPPIKAHSIIPVEGDGDYHDGRDGVVAYTSAHVDYAESELVVRGKHSCQNLPATIEEVRRILHEHLNEPR